MFFLFSSNSIKIEVCSICVSKNFIYNSTNLGGNVQKWNNKVVVPSSYYRLTLTIFRDKKKSRFQCPQKEN